MFQRIFDERDEQLRIYADQTRALTTLSSEIAHELKNPLASVKGLSALVARGLEGKPAERMDVLRGEVDRMQSILQEFLNYSRPLVPLSLQETDLGALARDTLVLHDGMARERDVDLRVDSDESALLQCDPRKIKQILINLVQNALDVAPRGSLVEVTIEADGDLGDLLLRLRDRGPGLDPEVVDRLFEAGVTSKETGSGLGLTVARGLARQHGGGLDLSDHPDGGCVAELRLPRVPPVESTRIGKGEP
jgi:signal transduction histidine kinase